MMEAGYLLSRRGVRGRYSDRIDALFSEWDRDRSPGAIVAAVLQGELIHQRGYGVASVAHDTPFTERTVLRLGSTSKHFCATCVLLLENRGLLSLDDDVREYVPEMTEYDTPISLRHLLTMTSGLWDGINLLLFAGLGAEHPIGREQMLALFRRQRRLMYAPGDDCTYSNSNYALLSLVVERVSGQGLAEFMRKELFAPLKMTQTALTALPGVVTLDKADGYVPAGEGRFEAGHMMIELCGDGGIDSTIGDMRKWLANYREDRLFGPRYRERLEAETRLNDGTLVDYRLGIQVSRYRGMEKVGHAGGMPGYLCDFVFFPEGDLGIVMFTNLTDPAMLELPDRIADIVLDKSFTRPKETAWVDAASAPAKDMIGVYAAENEGLLLELADRRGKLVCFLLGDLNPLVKEGDVFRSTKNQVSFRPGGDGLILRLGCSPAVMMQRQPDPRVAPAGPPADYGSFSGDYYCREIQEIHRVTLQEDGLRVALKNPVRKLVWDALTPVCGDMFCALIEGEPSCSNVTVRFLRNGDGQVTALVYNINRCHEIRFEKS